ncbi:MAG TPA: hypothetical protein VK166_00340 [Chitinophagaceae bacterium]|nr:hypothetical protein [Chitinophagaceae bacterium]
MKKLLLALLMPALVISCADQQKKETEKNDGPVIQGTWRLLSGTLIEKGDTAVTDYTKTMSFIKIINDTHFAFLKHDLNKGKDSTASFGAGGGSYVLKGNEYTEHLEYCNDREWEGHDFTFTVTISNDTLVQSGVEKIEAQGIERYNIEKYIRVR